MAMAFGATGDMDLQHAVRRAKCRIAGSSPALKSASCAVRDRAPRALTAGELRRKLWFYAGFMVPSTHCDPPASLRPAQRVHRACLPDDSGLLAAAIAR